MLEFKSYPKTPRLKNLHVRITQKLDGTNGVIAIEKLNYELDKPRYCFKVGSRNQWLPSPEEMQQRDEEISKWKKLKEQYKTVPFEDLFPYVGHKPEKLHDNHGFSKWAHENKEALIRLLGEGYHYGEWCGAGIQNGEGLKEKGFYLFSPRSRYLKLELDGINDKIDILNSINIYFVPELYNGTIGEEPITITGIIQYAMARLYNDGSRIGNGSVKPEGVIVEIENKLKFKVIF